MKIKDVLDRRFWWTDAIFWVRRVLVAFISAIRWAICMYIYVCNAVNTVRPISVYFK